MATFLQLCQAVARDSGTVSGAQPVSVVNQTGRLGKVVTWTAEAWTRIQNSRNAWTWMCREFTGATIAGTAAYTPASWDITDLAEWIIAPGTVTLYAASIGRADEGELRYLEWSDWRRLYDRGGATESRPAAFTIRPRDRAFLLGPTPDAAYVLRGEYRKTPQALAANTDVPECPARFHDLIKWRALMLLAEHDEAPLPLGFSMTEYRALLTDLERDQLPIIGIGGGPLA